MNNKLSIDEIINDDISLMFFYFFLLICKVVMLNTNLIAYEDKIDTILIFTENESNIETY